MAFCVIVSDVAVYTFPEGVSEEEARQQAWDWFNERTPKIQVEEYEPIDEDS